MRLNSLGSLNSVRYAKADNLSVQKNNVVTQDSFSSSRSNFVAGNNFLYSEKGNVVRLVSFLGAGKIKKNEETEYDTVPNFRMKVAAVSQFQDNIKEITPKDARRFNKINFEINDEKKEIKLFYDKTGKPIGFIHYEILDHIYDEIHKHPENFKIELSSFLKFPGMKNIGLKARIKYDGPEKEKISSKFEELLDDAECKPITDPPITPQSPNDILKVMLKYEEQINGTQSKQDMEYAINNIVREIKKDNNKNILLLGHKEPDGDCLGCVLGMKNAIELMNAGKNVDCSIDDRIPQLFRFLPGSGDIRLPDKTKLTKALDKQISALKNEGSDQEKISIFEKIKNDLSKNTKSLEKDKMYDLVILMDVASPDRLGAEFAKHIDPAKTKIIFIDHHPKRFSQWQQSKDFTNVDLNKVNENHLAWVADRVPAAAEMVSVIAGKLNPQINKDDVFKNSSQKEQKILKNMATAILTGVHTDTSSYSRSANLFTEDMSLPRYERPRYNPIGLAKWFSLITDRKVTRNFIDANLDNQEYKLKPLKDFVRTTLPNMSHRNDALQLGYVQVDKGYLDNIWMIAAKDNPDVTFKDIMGTLKYSSAFKSLKNSASYAGSKESKRDDAIAYMVTQSEIKGELNSSYNMSNKNKLSFSFRSHSGTNHAAILASLFGGGGHGAAAGGRVIGDDIDFNSKFLVLIDGIVEEDPGEILKVLNKNFELGHSSLPEDEQKKLVKSVSVIKSPDQQDGETVHELIADVVNEIRCEQYEQNDKNSLISECAV